MYSVSQIRAIVEKEARISLDGVDNDSNLGDLGIDSLCMMRILVRLENDTGVQLTGEDLDSSRFGKLSDLAKLVERATAERA